MVKQKPCQAEKLSGLVGGECEHVKNLLIEYGLGCAYPAHHSAVIRPLAEEDRDMKRIIIQVCDKHFEQLEIACFGAPTDQCMGLNVLSRIKLRKNRL